MYHIKRIFIYAVLFFVCTPAAAQESARLSFKEALQIAFSSSPQMIEARQMVEFSKGERLTARTFQNPEAELEISDSGLDSVEIKQPLDPLGVYLYKGQMA